MFRTPIPPDLLTKYAFKHQGNNLYFNGKISLFYKNGKVKIILPYPEPIVRILTRTFGDYIIDDYMTFESIIMGYDTLFGIPDNIRAQFPGLNNFANATA